ncbi:MAG: HAD family phosphatase [Acidimicrobiales bacterium]|jgi:HAD superfamily hydrolase (TIGR01509 family)
MGKAIVFDCDGVLVDSETAWVSGIGDVFASRGINFPSTEPDTDLHGTSVRAVISLLQAELGEPVDADELETEMYAAIIRRMTDGVWAIRGAIELLETVRGTRPLAVASNGSTETVMGALEAASIPDVFDTIVAFEPPLRAKPAPDLYLTACERLRVPPSEAIAIEDSLPGVRAARAAGLAVVGVGPAPGLEAEADLVVHDLLDPRLWELLGLEPSLVEEVER